MTQTDSRRSYVSLEDRVVEATALAASNQGVLPRLRSIYQSRPGLARALARRPEAFAHIPRESSRNIKLTDHVAAAEQLAKKSGGFLPRYSDLLKTDPRLAGAVRDRAYAFAHIPRATSTDKQTERLARRVALAEQLAAETGGVLRMTTQFYREHNALVMHMRRRPDAFAHIPCRKEEVAG